MIARLRPAAAAAAAVLALAAMASPGVAGTIGFRTDAEVKAGDGVDARVVLTHTGDEAASDVSVHVEYEGRVVDGTSVATIAPSATQSWELRLADRAEPGVRPVVIRVRYTDSNGYPFEIVSAATATASVTAAPRLFGSIDIPRLSGQREEKGRITVKRPPGRRGGAEVRVVVPSGLVVEPSTMRVEFDEGGRATAEVRVRNAKLLAGTTVNVFAFATADDPGFPQSDTIRGNVHVAAASMRAGKPRFSEAAAAVGLLLLVLEGVSFLRGGRRPEAAS